MCGICGIFYLEKDRVVSPILLKNMADIMEHRGPDDEGFYVAGRIGLGHRRLSIIDLDTGKQPISNENETVWIVFNGEIYNYLELRKALIARGHRFKTRTDTEVIIHAYEEYGADCLTKLNGMFAFAIWDDKQQTLFLARDRVGIKPLYYTRSGGALVFASEIKSILTDPSIPRRMNLGSIDRFLTYYYLPGEETLLEGIYKLSPGHYLIADEKGVTKRQYWDLHFDISPRWQDFNGAVEALREILRRSVKDHMISDVPVGVLLSGGVDSTGVLRYAVEQTDKPIRTFTIGFEGEKFADERPYARLAAEAYGTIHQDITMTSGDFREFLPRYVWHMEEPVCEPPAVALYYVSRLARDNGVKVLLSGEGGDEAFGGYQTYRNLLLLEKLKSVFGPSKGLLRLGFQALGRAGLKRFEHYGTLVAPTLSQYYLSRTSTPHMGFNRLKGSLYTEEFKEALRTSQLAESTNLATNQPFNQFDDLPINQSPLNYMLYMDTKTWLPDDLLVKADKMTMATSVELRVPLLDHNVLEFAASLPSSYKVHGLTTKYILKEAFKGHVPTEIIKRRKTGFPVPYESWLSTTLEGFVSDVVLDQKALQRGYFTYESVLGLLGVNGSRGAYGKEIFSLMSLELWHREFIDSVSGSNRSVGL